MRRLYPSVEYTGVDIHSGDSIDIVADATKTIPFKGLRFEREFDTILCSGFLPIRFLSIPFKNIRHLRDYIKDGGHLVAGCSDYCLPEVCRSVMDSFDILEERVHSFNFTRKDMGLTLLCNEHYIISVPKTKLKLRLSV